MHLPLCYSITHILFYSCLLFKSRVKSCSSEHPTWNFAVKLYPWLVKLCCQMLWKSIKVKFSLPKFITVNSQTRLYFMQYCLIRFQAKLVFIITLKLKGKDIKIFLNLSGHQTRGWMEFSSPCWKSWLFMYMSCYKFWLHWCSNRWWRRKDQCIETWSEASSEIDR